MLKVQSTRDELEAAARAAGLPINWLFPVDGGLFPLKQDPALPLQRHYPYVLDAEGFRVEWNPEHRNADSFRLLIALAGHLDVGNSSQPQSASTVSLSCGIATREPHDGDPEAATRRAIFRAAVARGTA